jgi:hypothetical protein
VSSWVEITSFVREARGVGKFLARLRKAGEEVPDYDQIRKEVNEGLEHRLSLAGTADAPVTLIELEKRRAGR